MFSIGTQTAYADEITATLVHTAGTRYGSAATQENTVDGENEYYNNDASSGWVGYAFAEFSFTIPEGESISKAELTWTASTTARSRDNKMYYLNAKTTLDYEKIASTQAVYNFGNERTYIGNTNFAKTKTSTTDVTDAVKAISTAGQEYIIFQWTGNAGSATLAGKGSANAPILKITTVSASSATKYTIKYVDESGKDIKDAVEYDGVIGQDFTATTEDMAAIYTPDKKYIYVSGNETKVAVKEATSNIITLKFREAAKWNYTFNAVDEEGNPLQEGIVKGTNFEGETFNVGYPYAINVDSTLYESDKLSSDKKGYYLSYTLEADNQVKDITFKPTTTTDIVFLSEAENIEGLTKATNNNTFVRSSNGGSAYAAEADVEITTLQPGKYKLTAVICDATKNAGSEWNFLAGENNIFKFTASTVNWAQGTSEEFEVNAETPIYLAKGGNANQAVDFIYIQKTGDAEALPTFTEVNSIAELHSLKFKDDSDEIPVKMNLKDAKITVLHKNSDYGMEMIDFATLEDATGAVTVSDLLMEATAEGMLEGNFEVGSVLNGTLYATLSWPNSLWASEDTEKSELTITTSNVEATVGTIAEILKPENDMRYFNLQNVTIKKSGDAEFPTFNFCQGEDTLQLNDAFALWATDGSDMPEVLAGVQGILYATYETFDQETPTYFFTPVSYDAPTAPAVPVVENIAGLSKVEGGEMEDPSVKLMLKNAKITYVQKMDEGIDPRAAVTFAILEDETGAVEISNIITKANANNWFEGELKEGVELNGYINVNFSSWSFALVANDETSKSELTVTPTTIVPTEAKIADLQKAENNLRLFELKDVDFAVEDDVPVIKQDDASIILADQFAVLPEDMPKTAKFESVVGVVFLDFESYTFCPISYKFATSDGISSIAVAAKNAAVYNLNGAKVRNIGESVKGLAKGIYVVGGKKIVVK